MMGANCEWLNEGDEVLSKGSMDYFNELIDFINTPKGKALWEEYQKGKGV